MEGMDAVLTSIWTIIADKQNKHPAPFPLTKSETRCRVFEEIEFDRHMYRQCFGEDFC